MDYQVLMDLGVMLDLMDQLEPTVHQERKVSSANEETVVIQDQREWLDRGELLVLLAQLVLLEALEKEEMQVQEDLLDLQVQLGKEDTKDLKDQAEIKESWVTMETEDRRDTEDTLDFRDFLDHLEPLVTRDYLELLGRVVREDHLDQ